MSDSQWIRSSSANSSAYFRDTWCLKTVASTADIVHCVAEMKHGWVVLLVVVVVQMNAAMMALMQARQHYILPVQLCLP